MIRTTATLMIAGLCLVGCSPQVSVESTDEVQEVQVEQSQQTLQVAQSFLEAAGTGDMDTLSGLMTDDFVWHNEGDKRVPWIGPWEGKEAVLSQFLPAFGAGLKVNSWTTDYSFSKEDQAVFIGTMEAEATNTGESTGPMSWAVRVQVVDGKVKSWNWFENSFAVSRAFQGQ